MDNKDLKAKYNEMHSQGQSAWFDSGDIERQAILEMGEPWEGLKVLEIGCGEGDLLFQILNKGAQTTGMDYSHAAIQRGKIKYPHQNLYCSDYRVWMPPWEECFVQDGNIVAQGPDRIVMQGVLEHLDKPFEELQWMIEHFKPKTVITSSPAFLNPRGIIWMTLDMLGAVMSKTDLHYLHSWEFTGFCGERGYKLSMDTVDIEWGNCNKMIEDLRKRIPLALKDGNIDYGYEDVDAFIEWLKRAWPYLNTYRGATNVYRIDVE